MLTIIKFNVKNNIKRSEFLMNKGFEELNQFGIKGIVAFWLRNFLFVLPIGLAVFSIYWIAQSSNKIWLVSIGASILTVNIFLTLVSLVSFAFLLLCCLNKQIIYSIEFTHHLFAILSFIGQILCCILMSLSSSTNTDVYLKSIEDYCERNPSNKVVTKFISNNPTQYSRFKYVAKRSTDLYPSISAFFGIWFSSTVFYLICSSGLSGAPPEHAPLLSNQQQPSEVQQDSEHQDHEQPEQGIVQPWVRNTDSEQHDDEVGDDQEEINITTNTNINKTNNNEIQNPIQTTPMKTNPEWVKPPEAESTEKNNNPIWVTTQDQNYEYSYEEEDG